MGPASPAPTTRVVALAERLASGEVVVIDGATGTELERLGVPMVEGAWCGDAVRTHPDQHRQVHRQHLDAGAEVIIANTFASSRHLLAQASVDAHFELINRRAVELARQARDEAGRGEVVVAGSMSTSRQGGAFPPLDVARRNFADQASLLAGAGADLLILEMMRDIPQTLACAQGAIETGLPVWLGWACKAQAGAEPALWELDATLRDAIAAVAELPIDLMAIMHTEVDEVDVCLDVLDDTWQGPVGVYAHSGEFVHPHWVFDEVIGADDYARRAMGWLDRGVQVIGGCCGITSDHIRVLAGAVRARPDGAGR